MNFIWCDTVEKARRNIWNDKMHKYCQRSDIQSVLTDANRIVWKKHSYIKRISSILSLSGSWTDISIKILHSLNKLLKSLPILCKCEKPLVFGHCEFDVLLLIFGVFFVA